VQLAKAPAAGKIVVVQLNLDSASDQQIQLLSDDVRFDPDSARSPSPIWTGTTRSGSPSRRAMTRAARTRALRSSAFERYERQHRRR
jgi:hypothetical protein